MSGSVNLDDVARAARVSPSTVSRVLNDSGPVAAATRKRVLRAIEDLQFRPNRYAQTLAKRSSRTLGVIVSNLNNPYFLDIYSGIEKAARAENYSVLLANTGYRKDRLAECVDLMVGYRLDGIIAVVSESDSDLVQHLCQTSLPLVIAGVTAAGQPVANILVDCRSSMRRLVEYLWTLGHRRFAFVGHHSGLESIHERREAFLRVLAAHAPGLEPSVVFDEDSMQGGEQACRDLLDRNGRPTAIVCVNDLMAVGVLKGLQKAGIAVPRDVSVTGFDNLPVGEFVTPTLTTVEIPRARLASLAVSEILRRLQPGDRTHRDLVVTPHLLIRESTGPAPADE